MKNWILKTGTQTIDCLSFPFAFRTMFNMVKKGVEIDKKSITAASADLVIIGPQDARGDRKKYSYDKASAMATMQGLLTSDGQLNSKEFKKFRTM